MSIYIDTSALLAVMDADDSHHDSAKKAWIELLESKEILVCNNYVLLEICALIQNRLGMAAIRAFYEDVFPILKIEWIDDFLHRQAFNALLIANKRNLSLVDCTSFNTMRQMNIMKVFTFDKHFAEQGFANLPSFSLSCPTKESHPQ